MACRLILIGTGHVFRLGDTIEGIIDREMPDAVAVELDAARAYILETSSNKSRKYSNFLYRILAMTQTIIARKFNVLAGEEMRAALHAARRNNIPLFYIDMNSDDVIRRLWASLSLRKKISFIASLFLIFFIGKKDIENSLEHFEEDAENVFDELEKTFPEIKHILIDERNEFMAEKIRELISMTDKIVAVVGEGHIPGLVPLLECENIHIDVIHLSHLLKK
ncbi:MAG: hypothetical protein DRN07_01390 [Thermoplasmata archaeon]|nr:MAG: hypothetical protein DRN07_01390 [Thermoplasmata archaeon]